jgi:hypothetical protein
MPAITAAQKAKAARKLARRFFVDQRKTATVTLDHIEDAIQAIDDAFEGLPGDLPNQAKSLTANLNLSLPEPFKTKADAEVQNALVAFYFGFKFGAMD